MTDDFQQWLDGGEFKQDLKIKGYDYVRSDVAQVTKTVQYDIFEALLTPDSSLDIEQYLSDVVSDIVSGQYDDDKIGIPFGMSKHPTEYGSVDRTPQPQYRGAKFANEFVYEGDAMQSGDKPKYYYIVEGATGGEVPSHYQSDTKEDGDCVDAVSVMNASDLPEGCRIDYPKMARKTVLDPCQAILRTLGLDPSVVEDVIRRETPAEYRRSDGQTGLSASEWM
jgi:DNA polymerase elongation subunit (family B)